MTNQPEKAHYDRIMRVSVEIVERKIDLKELWQSAKEDLDKDALAVLKVAVKRALADREKLDAQRQLEDEADDLIKALGPFADTPLGRITIEAAQ